MSRVSSPDISSTRVSNMALMLNSPNGLSPYAKQWQTSNVYNN